MRHFTIKLGTLLALITLSAGVGAQMVGSNTAPGKTDTFKLTLNSQEVLQDAQRLAREHSNQEIDWKRLILAISIR